MRKALISVNALRKSILGTAQTSPNAVVWYPGPISGKPYTRRVPKENTELDLSTENNEMSMIDFTATPDRPDIPACVRPRYLMSA